MLGRRLVEVEHPGGVDEQHAMPVLFHAQVQPELLRRSRAGSGSRRCPWSAGGAARTNCLTRFQNCHGYLPSSGAGAGATGTGTGAGATIAPAAAARWSWRLLGGGLVLLVTPPVKLSMLLTTVLAAFSMPLTTVLAKSAPGSVGSVTGVPPPEGDGMGVDEGREAPCWPTQGR